MAKLNTGDGFEPGGQDGTKADDLQLASLLSSRICHDLISPIAAVSNGVEFLDPSIAPEAREHAVRVINDGARDARGRLQFYRAAFGLSGAMADVSPIEELRELALGFLTGGKVTLDWPESDATLERPAARLLLNQILLVAEALPRGGRAQVGAVRRGALNMVVMADGPKIKFDERAESLLRHGVTPDPRPIDPKEAPLLLTHRLSVAINAELTLAKEEGQIVVAFTV